MLHEIYTFHIYINQRRRTMKDFLEFITKHLVDSPDQVKIVFEEKENKAIFTLSVAELDCTS